MARVAKCPQCEHELFVPDEATAGGLAKCPACKSFFELAHAESREIPTVLLVEDTAASSAAQTKPTLADLSSVATWTSDSQHDLQTDEAGEQSVADQPPPVFADRLVEQDQISNQPGEEPHDVAAERIDAWFRSAKTLEDVPHSESQPAAQSDDYGIQPASVAPGSATIDLSANEAISTANSDFELEPPAVLPGDAAAWDDSQDMDRLLAGIKTQPADRLKASDHETIPAKQEEQFRAAEDWSPDASLSIHARVGEPRRKRSLVRTLLVSAFGGVIGLALGYYALLWLRGPEIDFWDVAKYLPKAALPASFQAETEQSPAAQPTNMATDVATTDQAAEAAPQTTAQPAEKQATFTAPAAPTKSSGTADDRYGTNAATSAPGPREPAALEAPPAKPLAQRSRPVSVHFANVPSFKVSELTTALQAAEEGQPKLMNGNLTDGKEVQNAKGFGYKAMADLAQKLTFVEHSSSPSQSRLSQEIEGLFRQTLSNKHTQEEVAQIVPKWIASPNRRHGGIFFAGRVTGQESQGSVVECEVDLGGGQSLTVLLPAAAAQQIKASSRPVGIAGWLVPKPAEQIKGYTGTAPQAVFAKKLISLE